MVHRTSQIFPPWVIQDIHAKSDLGRYRIRGFSSFQKVTHFDDLTFLSTGLINTLFPFVIPSFSKTFDLEIDSVRICE